jgi:hypothetical protein
MLSPAGDHIFKEGELGQEMYIMEKGAVVLSRYRWAGRAALTFSTTLQPP